MSAADSAVAAAADEIADWAPGPLAELVGVSSPSGDREGAERSLALCARLLGETAEIDRVPCSTAGGTEDLVATFRGTGTRRLLLLGHVDTVVGHGAHRPLRRGPRRWPGTGTVDMKGGDILALGVARTLARDPAAFAELAVLMVTDEEWRTQPFAHASRFAGFDACLCFEGGQRSAAGEEEVVVRRKAAGTLRVLASGRAAHSGSAPDDGANALLALARTAAAIASHHHPAGASQLSVVPTVMHSGDAFNVVPSAGELIFDLRARDLEAFGAVLAAVGTELDGVALSARMERNWPGMDTTAATAGLLAGAAARLGRPLLAAGRGGASDASHFAATIPLTVDGLGPLGGGAHTPDEYLAPDSLAPRAAVALALAHELLAS